MRRALPLVVAVACHAPSPPAPPNAPPSLPADQCFETIDGLPFTGAMRMSHTGAWHMVVEGISSDGPTFTTQHWYLWSGRDGTLAVNDGCHFETSGELRPDGFRIEIARESWDEYRIDGDTLRQSVAGHLWTYRRMDCRAYAARYAGLQAHAKRREPYFACGN